MNQDERAAVVAERLFGMKRCTKAECDGCDSEIFLDGTQWKVRTGEFKFWNPYESADDDYAVLRAVREKCLKEDNPKLFYEFEWALSDIRLRRVESSEFMLKHWDDVGRVEYGDMFPEPGDYTDAAVAVLQGEQKRWMTDPSR